MADRTAVSFASALAALGIAHLAAPRWFDNRVPRALPGSPRAYTVASGAAEIAAAAAVAAPPTRRAGAVAAAALLTLLLPGSVTMAWRWRKRPALERWLAYAGVPLQLPLIAWALGVRSTTVSAAAPRGSVSPR